MRKVFAILALVGLLAAFGCQNGIICQHRTAVENIINGIIVGASMLPAEYADIANVILAEAQILLAAKCPTIEAASVLSQRLVQAEKEAMANGYIMGRKMK